MIVAWWMEERLSVGHAAWFRLRGTGKMWTGWCRRGPDGGRHFPYQAGRITSWHLIHEHSRYLIIYCGIKECWNENVAPRGYKMCPIATCYVLLNSEKRLLPQALFQVRTQSSPTPCLQPFERSWSRGLSWAVSASLTYWNGEILKVEHSLPQTMHGHLFHTNR